MEDIFKTAKRLWIVLLSLVLLLTASPVRAGGSLASSGIAIDKDKNLIFGNGRTGELFMVPASKWWSDNGPNGTPVHVYEIKKFADSVLSAGPLAFDPSGNLIVGGGRAVDATFEPRAADGQDNDDIPNERGYAAVINAQVLKDTADPKVPAYLIDEEDAAQYREIVPDPCRNDIATGILSYGRSITINWINGTGNCIKGGGTDWWGSGVTSKLTTYRINITADLDGDGFADVNDHSPWTSHTDNRDTDGDGYGNIIDADYNNDGMVDYKDLAFFENNYSYSDLDMDGDGNVSLRDWSIFASLYGQTAPYYEADTMGGGGWGWDGAQRENALENALDNPVSDKAKKTYEDADTEVGCSVNTTLREFHDKALDLSVKVAGGHIRLKRFYLARRWQWQHQSFVMDGRPDDDTAYVPNAAGPDYITRDGVVFAKREENCYVQGANTITREPDAPPYDYSASKYLYKDREGNFRQYDSLGRLISFGSRYGTVGILEYESREVSNASGIYDRDNTLVFQFEYDENGNLIKVRDRNNRKVVYGYTEDLLTTVTDALDQVSSYAYDPAGNLIKTIDAQGRTTNILYQVNGWPVVVTDDTGGVLRFLYSYDDVNDTYYARIISDSGKIKEVRTDNLGRTTRVDVNGRTIKRILYDGLDLVTTDEKGNRTRTEYDEQENLTRIVYPDTNQVRFTYDLRFNKITGITDQLGRVTQIEYDDHGNAVKKTEAKGTEDERVGSFTYDELGRVLTRTLEADDVTGEAVTTFSYDAPGNLESLTGPMGNRTRYLEYDVMGNLLKYEDARGNQWSFDYDALGRRTLAATPSGYGTAYFYDGVNNLIAVIDARNNRHAYEYDARNNRIKETDPFGRSTITIYNSDDLPVSITSREGWRTSTEYDNEGRTTRALYRGRNETRYTYDEAPGTLSPYGKPAAISYPFFTRKLTYDCMGKVIKETDVLDSETSLERTRTYDAAGNLASFTDEGGRTTTYEYDALNRLSVTVAPNGARTVRSHDDRDNLISVEDPGQGIRHFSYDKNNRLISTTTPEGRTTLYEYGPTGNRIAVIDPSGRRITCTYSPENRIVRTDCYETAASESPVKITGFTYDEVGNLLTWDDGSASAAMVYDALSQKLSETVDYGGFTLSHGYTYTAEGAVSTYTDPEGEVTTYEYGSKGHLSTIKAPSGREVSFLFNSASWNRLNSMHLPGAARYYNYDPLNRIKSIFARDPANNAVMYEGYTYDSVGNRLKILAVEGGHTYEYDTLDRLTAATHPGVLDEAYTYDNLGNRTSDASVQGSISHNADNELETYGTTEYAYDANGAVIRKTDGETVTKFFYNTENRMERVEDGTGAVIAQYGYDPFGRRIWKQVGGGRTWFHYCDQGLAGEYGSDGTQLRSYGYKPGTAWTGDPLFMKVGETYYWCHNDRAGTPKKLKREDNYSTDGDWEGEYQAFGRCTVKKEAITFNLRFAGQYFDQETGLHYNLNRYYDPRIGRYLRPDPAGEGVNFYLYCLNNPVMFIDPLGLCPENNISWESAGKSWIRNVVFGFGAYYGLTKLFEVAPKSADKGGLNLFKWGDKTSTKPIGWKDGDGMLHLPDKGSPKANWKQNVGHLRKEMGKGKPIFDSYRDAATGKQIPTKGFLNAERNLLETRGWRYNPQTGAYHPPGN
ncbi:MAG: RHS repeat protein [Desulfobacteraceae bacterium]|nr:RHS repeat protein [Desulfobacteraceae bacterium]